MTAETITIARDEDCPECGFPETFAEGILSCGPFRFGCRKCGWRSPIDVRRLPGHTRTERLAEYLKLDPGCTITSIAGAFDLDGADAWLLVTEAERERLITKSRPNGSTWAFEAVA